MSEFITREQLLKLGQSPRRIKVEEIGGIKFRIQSLTEKEKANYEADLMEKGGGFNRNRLIDARLRLIIRCLVDEQGNQMLTDGDIKVLQEMDGGIVSELADHCRSHCGFDELDIEETLKNSASVRVESSPTD